MGLNFDQLDCDRRAYECAEQYLEDEPCSNNPALYREYSIKLARHIHDAVQQWMMSE